MESNNVLDTGLSFSFIRNFPADASILVSSDFYLAARDFPVTGTAQGYAAEYDFSLKPNVLLNMPRVFRDDLSTEASVSYTYATMRYGASLDLF